MKTHHTRRSPAGSVSGEGGVMAARVRRLLSFEVVSFLVVGGVGYVVDVGVFNLLWGHAPFDQWGPTSVKVIAVAAAMVVTYLGNALVTWRGRAHASVRELVLFVVSNVIGLGFSVVTLWISHDLLGLTSRLADNVSGNVVGLALGTAFRFVAYRYLVFADRPPAGADGVVEPAARPERVAA